MQAYNPSGDFAHDEQLHRIYEIGPEEVANLHRPAHEVRAQSASYRFGSTNCVLSAILKAYKLSSLSKLKCSFPLTTLSNVIYKIRCAECSEFYIGKTERRLCQRIKEHMTSCNSALRKHSMETGHRIDFQSPSVLACDNLSIRLLVKESLFIKEQLAYKSLNGKVVVMARGNPFSLDGLRTEGL